MSAVLNKFRKYYCLRVGDQWSDPAPDLCQEVVTTISNLSSALSRVPSLRDIVICPHGSAIYDQWKQGSDVDISLVLEQAFSSMDFRKFNLEVSILSGVGRALREAGLEAVEEHFKGRVWLVKATMTMFGVKIPLDVCFSNPIAILNTIALKSIMRASSNTSEIVKKAFIHIVRRMKEEKFVGPGAGQVPGRSWCPGSYGLSQIFFKCYDVEATARELSPNLKFHPDFSVVSTFFKMDDPRHSGYIYEHVLHETGVWEECFGRAMESPSRKLMNWVDNYTPGQKLLDPLNNFDMLSSLNHPSSKPHTVRGWLEALRLIAKELESMTPERHVVSNSIANGYGGVPLQSGTQNNKQVQRMGTPAKPPGVLMATVEVSFAVKQKPLEPQESDPRLLRALDLSVPAQVLSASSVLATKPKHEEKEEDNWVEHSAGLRVLAQWGQEAFSAIVKEVDSPNRKVMVKWCDDGKESIVPMSSILATDPVTTHSA